MQILKQKWKLPSADDGNAWMIRAIKAEEHLKESLNVLHYIKQNIPEEQGSETKVIVEMHLMRFK